MMKEQTIAAIATPLAVGGIGVVRLSGEQALEVAQRVFVAASGRKASEMSGYTAAYGRVRDDQGFFDEAVLTVFRAPHSFTGEDVAELSCHGGVYLVRRLLRAAMDAGAAPAEPGEFTKRAFLNGKMTLTQAEAVGDLIQSQSNAHAKAALSLRDGVLYRRLREVCGELTQVAGHLSAWVDYPDEEIEELGTDNILEVLGRSQAELKRLMDTYESGRILRQGVSTAIVGRPNVGKSTLMNLLSGRNRSIVTEIAGTTRDIVEDTVRIGDIVLNLADTAGIRETSDLVEKIGVEQAQQRMEESFLILAVFDSSQELQPQDRELLRMLEGKNAIGIINKIDLPQRLDTAEVGRQLPHVVALSANDRQGAAVLEKELGNVLGLSVFDPSAATLANERQRGCANAALRAVEEAICCVQSGMTLDAVTVCMTDAVGCISELTGESASQAVIDEVFSKFCVGK